jgi:ketosteroid isomerase-like protein
MMPDQSRTPDLVELYQRGADAFNAGDLDTFIGFYAPDAVIEMVGIFGTWEGRAAIRAFFEDWLGAFDEVRLEFEAVRDLGNDVFFGVLVQEGRRQANAGWVQLRSGYVSTVVDGLIERTTYYLDIDEARAAAERLAQERG